MTDDARRPMTEEGLARIQAARRDGRSCALCGRGLAEGETVWMERVVVALSGWRLRSYRAPVGAGCASPELVRATEGAAPERCAGCGRGVHYRSGAHSRRVALCSKRCSSRYQQARAREAKERG